MEEELITIVYYWQDGHAWIFDRKPPENCKYEQKEFDQPITFYEACQQVTIMWQP